MDILFLILATLFFLGGFVYSVMALRSKRYHPGYLNLVLIGLGFVCQCGFLNIRGQLHGKCPITNGAEVLVFIAWSLAIMYFVLGRAFRLSLVGTFTAPILAIMHLLGLTLSLVNPVVADPAENLDPWLEMHKAMSLLAYGTFALAAISGIMFLVQNRQLKSGKPGFLSFNLPPIRFLSDAMVRLLSIGLLLLTIGVTSAFFMEEKATPFHLSIFGGVWATYIGVLIYHFVKRPSAKWLSFASLIAFAIALITLSAI